MTKLIAVLAAFCQLIICGCASTGFEKFYAQRGTVNFAPIAPTNVVILKFKTEDNVYEYVKRVVADGATILGDAAWEGPFTDPEKARNKAATVGANIVCVSIDYSHTRSGVFNQSQYHAGQSTTLSTHHSGTVYGQAGPSSYSGTSTTTGYTPGYTTYSSVPYSVSRYDHSAVFLRYFSSTETKDEPPREISSDDVLKLRQLDTVVAAQPTNVAALTAIGDIYGRNRHFDLALPAYKAALSLEPTNDLIRFFVINTYTMLGQHEQAKAEYNQFGTNSSVLILCQVEIGKYHLRAPEDIDESEKYFQAAIDTFSEYCQHTEPNTFIAQNASIAHGGLALIAQKRDRIALACDHTYRAGILALASGDRQRALLMADMLKTLDESNPARNKLLELIYSEKTP